MFSIQMIDQKIRDLRPNASSVDDFEDWFASASCGYYDVNGDSVSNAIAAISHVLYSYQAGDLDENQVPKALATAIRPFVDLPVVSPIAYSYEFRAALPDILQVQKWGSVLVSPHRVQTQQWTYNANENVGCIVSWNYKLDQNPRVPETAITEGASNSTQPPPRRDKMNSFSSAPIPEIRAVA